MKYAEKGRKFSQVSVRYSDDAGGSRLLERGEGICIVTAAAWIFLLPVTWNTIKKRFHVAKALPVLLPVKKCETFPELFHISLLFPVPFPEAAPQQPVCPS